MTDQELLELAAKAAGYEILRTYSDGSVYVDPGPGKRGLRWSPLTEDGDALRLAVKLQISIERRTFTPDVVFAHATGADEGCFETLSPEPGVATRRAIVRAAAEIGKTK